MTEEKARQHINQEQLVGGDVFVLECETGKNSEIRHMASGETCSGLKREQIKETDVGGMGP